MNVNTGNRSQRVCTGKSISAHTKEWGNIPSAADRYFVTTDFLKKMKRRQAIQIGDNVGSIMKLPCVEQCFKTVSGNIRFKGTFECKRKYAIHGDWLVEFDDGTWRCMSREEFERIKDR